MLENQTQLIQSLFHECTFNINDVLPYTQDIFRDFFSFPFPIGKPEWKLVKRYEECFCTLISIACDLVLLISLNQMTLN